MLRYSSRAGLPSPTMCPRVVAVSNSPSCGWRYCSRYISGSTGQKVSVPYMSICDGRVSMQCCQTSSCQCFIVVRITGLDELPAHTRLELFDGRFVEHDRPPLS